jgi:hypothetical protein
VNDPLLQHAEVADIKLRTSQKFSYWLKKCCFFITWQFDLFQIQSCVGSNNHVISAFLILSFGVFYLWMILCYSMLKWQISNLEQAKSSHQWNISLTSFQCYIPVYPMTTTIAEIKLKSNFLICSSWPD